MFFPLGYRGNVTNLIERLFSFVDSLPQGTTLGGHGCTGIFIFSAQVG